MLRKKFHDFRNKLTIGVEENLRNHYSLLGLNTILTMRSRHEYVKELADASIKVYSQWGEDGIIDFICEKLNLRTPSFIEFGVGNFDECNSRFIAEARGASVIAIDGRNDLIENINKKKIRFRLDIQPIQTWINPQTAKSIFENAIKEKGKIDIISIDIDGNDYWVLENLNLENTQLVIVEFNPFLGYKKAITIPRDDNFVRIEKGIEQDYYGASLLAWINLMSKKDFTFLGCNIQNTNAFFIKKVNIQDFVTIQINDLSEYVNCKVRDYRDEESKFNYISNYQRSLNLVDRNFIDTETMRMVKFDKSFI